MLWVRVSEYLMLILQATCCVLAWSQAMPYKSAYWLGAFILTAAVVMGMEK